LGCSTITDKIHKHSLAFELSRLDDLQAVIYQSALGSDVQCGALILKIAERRAAPRETSTDRIERALNAPLTEAARRTCRRG
jgi:hypothetical protein